MNKFISYLKEEYLTEITLKDHFEKYIEPKYGHRLDYGFYVNYAELDPTTNGNNRGRYVEWIIKTVMNTHSDIEDYNQWKNEVENTLHGLQLPSERMGIDLPKHLALFDLRSKGVDINKFKTFTDLCEYADSLPPSEREKKKAEKEIFDKPNDIQMIDVNDNWIVARPLTWEGNKKLACYKATGADWCTARQEDSNHFDQYNAGGTLVVFINRKDPTEKVQFYVNKEMYIQEVKDEGNNSIDKQRQDELIHSSSNVKKYFDRLTKFEEALADMKPEQVTESVLRRVEVSYDDMSEENQERWRGLVSGWALLNAGGFNTMSIPAFIYLLGSFKEITIELMPDVTLVEIDKLGKSQSIRDLFEWSSADIAKNHSFYPKVTVDFMKEEINDYFTLVQQYPDKFPNLIACSKFALDAIKEMAEDLDVAVLDNAYINWLGRLHYNDEKPLKQHNDSIIDKSIVKTLDAINREDIHDPEKGATWEMTRFYDMIFNIVRTTDETFLSHFEKPVVADRIFEILMPDKVLERIKESDRKHSKEEGWFNENATIYIDHGFVKILQLLAEGMYTEQRYLGKIKALGEEFYKELTSYIMNNHRTWLEFKPEEHTPYYIIAMLKKQDEYMEFWKTITSAWREEAEDNEKFTQSLDAFIPIWLNNMLTSNIVYGTNEFGSLLRNGKL